MTKEPAYNVETFQDALMVIVSRSTGMPLHDGVVKKIVEHSHFKCDSCGEEVCGLPINIETMVCLKKHIRQMDYHITETEHYFFN